MLGGIWVVTEAYALYVKSGAQNVTSSNSKVGSEGDGRGDMTTP